MVFKNKYNLIEPDERQKGRLIEILFYMTFQPLFQVIDQYNFSEGRNFGDDFIQLVALMCGFDIGKVRLTFHKINSRSAKPTKREVVIASRYFGFSYKKINDLFGIHQNTVTKYVERYEMDWNETLVPRLTTEEHERLKEVFMPIFTFFIPMSSISKEFYKTDFVKKLIERNEESAN